MSVGGRPEQQVAAMSTTLPMVGEGLGGGQGGGNVFVVKSEALVREGLAAAGDWQEALFGDDSY